MALFSDGSISTTDDLAAYDSAIMDVASTEGIDLTRKLALAQDELSVMLTSLLPEDQSCGLGNVVVTTPLRLWHTLRTLALAYEDAYYNQLNDRYQGKWQAFAERARWAQEQLMQAGAGFVTDPIPQAQPAVLTEAPAPQPAATYYATVTWVNASGQEGAPAELRSLEAARATRSRCGRWLRRRTRRAGTSTWAFLRTRCTGKTMRPWPQTKPGRSRTRRWPQRRCRATGRHRIFYAPCRGSCKGADDGTGS